MRKTKFFSASNFCLSKSHRSGVSTLFGTTSPNSEEQLHRKLLKFVGPFISSLDTRFRKSFEERICMDLGTCIRRYRGLEEYSTDQYDLTTSMFEEEHIESQNDSLKEYGKDQIIRDLFLWAVFMDMPEMAKVLLIHVRSRLCAAMIASTIFKQYAKLAATVYLREKLNAQALIFETYAAICIDRCYEYNERTACELLFRRVPLFGYVTCMQVI